MKKIRLMNADAHRMVREGVHSLRQDDPHMKVVGEAEIGEEE